MLAAIKIIFCDVFGMLQLKSSSKICREQLKEQPNGRYSRPIGTTCRTRVEIVSSVLL